MKLLVITTVMSILFSSCLKQSIPDAMLAAKNADKERNSVTATLSYEVNGNAVNISVNDADNQDRSYYTLGLGKSGDYTLEALSGSGELTFTFYTDSLSTGNYNFTGIYGDTFMMSYNGEAEYVHVASDSMSFNITSYKAGHISGNFSGQLTPLVMAGTISNTYGTPGSVLITKGSFQNVPVFY